MPRIRTIKPETWADEKLASLPRDARLLFLALISNADDDGRMRGSVLFVRAACFPYDPDLDVGLLMGLLSKAGFIEQYDRDGQSFLVVNNFKRHQRIERPQPSPLPAPPSRSPIDHGSITDRSRQEWNGMEGKGKEKEPAQSDEKAVALAPAAALLAEFIRKEWPDVHRVEEYAGRAQAAFPGVDLASEARRARGWETANPRLAKKNHGRFLWNWFSRAQDGASQDRSIPRGVVAVPVRALTPSEQEARTKAANQVALMRSKMGLA